MFTIAAWIKGCRSVLDETCMQVDHKLWLYVFTMKEFAIYFCIVSVASALLLLIVRAFSHNVNWPLWCILTLTAVTYNGTYWEKYIEIFVCKKLMVTQVYGNLVCIYKAPEVKFHEWRRYMAVLEGPANSVNERN